MFIQISSLVSPGTLLSAIALSCEPNASWISVLTGPLPSPTKPILLLMPIGGQSIGLPGHMAKLLGTILVPPFPCPTQPANPSCLQIPAGSPPLSIPTPWLQPQLRSPCPLLPGPSSQAGLLARLSLPAHPPLGLTGASLHPGWPCFVLLRALHGRSP